MNKNEETNKLSRRNFIKLSTVAGVGTAIGGVSILNDPKKSTAYAFDFMVKEHDDIPLEISPDIKQFDQKYSVFIRGLWDEKIIEHAKKYFPVSSMYVPSPIKQPGWEQVDNALSYAAWAVHIKEFGSKTTDTVANTGLYSWEDRINENKVIFETPQKAAKTVKKAAKSLGADLVGIAPYDERWMYSDTIDAKTGESVPIELPFEPKSVIAMAVEMDYDVLKASPSALADTATGYGYSRMAETAHSVATFLRMLGYQAIPTGNDTALSIPIAIQAGLGELSRMGTLITKEYGPRVRLLKVFTDLDIAKDKPISFGVWDFCKVCMKCADNCPSGAISKDIEPNYNTTNVSSYEGVKKWYINGEKCFGFWAENGSACGACVSCCPYNKIEEWHHDLAKLATVTPGLKLVAREFDELFGYGKIYNKNAITDFWESE